MHHLTTYRTSGWPAGQPHTRQETTMDPMFAKALVDTSVPLPPAPRHRQRPKRTPRLRPRAATVMRRVADRLDREVMADPAGACG